MTHEVETIHALDNTMVGGYIGFVAVVFVMDILCLLLFQRIFVFLVDFGGLPGDVRFFSSSCVGLIACFACVTAARDGDTIVRGTASFILY